MIVGTGGPIDLGAFGNEELHSAQMTGSRRLHQGSSTPFSGVFLQSETQ